MLTTTLKEIRGNSPCAEGWSTLVESLDVSPSDAKGCNKPITLIHILESNGMDDALWVLDECINPHICRLFAADCAERVLHLFEAERPDDDRPRKAIEIARDPAAGDAARSAARSAARDAGDAAGDAAREEQKSRLIQYLTYGEAAKDMPWE